ncbi:MAG TPA: ATP-binding protein [Candidatus Saccharimonadales bacterium]|jgi:transitional endoplasmic reticulum ATPase
MMVTVYDDGSIHATNQRRAVSIEPSDTDTRMVEIHAPAVQAVDEQSQLRGVSRIFMKTLDVANSVTTPDRLTRLKRTYHIGDQPRPLGYTTHAIKSLGAHTIRGAVGRPEQLENTADRLSDDELKKEIGISVEESRVLLEDIGGLRGVKAKLYDIATSFTHPGVMKRWGAERPQGVLLYGEPGTGKTMLVEALANAIGAKLWRIQSSDIYDQWIGSSEAKIKELFRQAQAITEPTIILFDEFDSIVGTSEEPSSDSGAATRNSVSGIFKQEMNDLAVKNPNVLVAATTNSFDRIDGALIRSGRFDHKLLVPMPDTEGRAEIMAGIIGKAIAFQEGTGFKPFADGIDINRLAEATDGMSGADLNELFRRIRFKKAMQEALTGSADPISHEELEATIRDFRTQG